MKPQIPWLRVFVEGVVIVGSILLAFGIDAWWEGRQEREEEQEYLIRLHAELSGAREELQNHHRRMLRSLAAMDTLLLIADQESPDAGDGMLAQTILNGGSYELSTYTTVFDQTYSEMLATGKLGVIRDPDLRSEVVGYYRIANQIPAVIEEATAAGYRAWGTRVRSVMGTLPRSWFSSDRLSQGFGLAREPSMEEMARLLALLGLDTGWQGEVRHARTRVGTIELWLRQLVAATDPLVASLAAHELVEG